MPVPATQPAFNYPTQDDVRLNPPAHAPWWENMGSPAPHLPATEGWRRYDPAQQSREYEFLLREVLDVDALERNVTGYESIARNFNTLSDFELMATAMHDVSHEGDRDPVRMRVVSDEEGARRIETFLPPAISGSDGRKGLHQQYAEAGWTGISGSPAYGGTGIPHGFAGGITEMSMSANPGYAVLELLSQGVIKALEAKGSDELKEAWLPRLTSGQFTGAMVMTEPNYGSSLVDMETTVQLDENGQTGKVYGYKRFLSSADHDATLGENGERNIIHMVLVRTADKDGTIMLDEKGRPKLTLMLVPRVLLDKDGNYIDEDGNVVDKPNTNHVRAAKLNDKMGLEVQSNTDAAYDGAKGYVVGEVGEGLDNMFIIMNEARLGVGLQGVGIAELVRQNVERYTSKERKQGPGGEIINYPDVQDKILTLRAHIDAGRAIAAEVGMEFDKALHAKPEFMTEAERKEAQRYVDVMTPLVKWGLTEKCDRAVDQGIQAMGGAGYMREWGMAQTYIDSRISRIYEGANGVLAIALAKYQLENMGAFLNKVRKDLHVLNADSAISDIVDPVNKALRTFETATNWMLVTGLRARGGDAVAIQEFQGAASHYMELMYGVAAGTALARNAHVANEKLLEGGVEEDRAFYEAKIATARYYTNAVLGQEHKMHYNKMTQNTQHLELPDHNLEKDAPTAFQQGARSVTMALVSLRDIIPGLAPGGKEKGR